VRTRRTFALSSLQAETADDNEHSRPNCTQIYTQVLSVSVYTSVSFQNRISILMETCGISAAVISFNFTNYTTVALLRRNFIACISNIWCSLKVLCDQVSKVYLCIINTRVHKCYNGDIMVNHLNTHSMPKQQEVITNRLRVLDEDLCLAKLVLVRVHVDTSHQMVDALLHVTFPLRPRLRRQNSVPLHQTCCSPATVTYHSFNKPLCSHNSPQLNQTSILIDKEETVLLGTKQSQCML